MKKIIFQIGISNIVVVLKVIEKDAEKKQKIMKRKFCLKSLFSQNPSQVSNDVPLIYLSAQKQFLIPNILKLINAILFFYVYSARHNIGKSFFSFAKIL